MKTLPAQSLFFHRLNSANKSRIPIGVAFVSLALAGFANAQVDANSQVNFCQKTAQDALDACQQVAQSARSVALGKCLNISDPTARADCQKQSTADYQDALQTCQDGYASRQAACQKFGPARYDAVINPANFVRHVTNPFFPLPPGQTFVYEGQSQDGFVHNDEGQAGKDSRKRRVTTSGCLQTADPTRSAVGGRCHSRQDTRLPRLYFCG